MNFIDFQLRAWVAGENEVQVMVHSSPVGAMRRPVKVTCDLSDYRKTCDWIRKEWLSRPGIVTDVVAAGNELAKILLPPEVNSYLMRSLAKLDKEGLRVRLCLDEALIDGPWEFMRCPDALEDEVFDGFLVLNPRVSLVREAPVESSKLEPSEEQQRMVVVGALRFDGKDEWQVTNERQELIKALEPVQEFLTIDDKFTTAAGDAIGQALSERLSVFHYVGHVQVENGQAFLVREITSEDHTDAVCDTGHFSPLYSERELDGFLHRAEARIAVFSACNSGRWPFVKPLLKKGLPALIGVQGSTTCDAAVAFCQKLYASLAVGLSLDESVIYARLHLQRDKVLNGSDSCEWGSYMVYMPTTEAVLLPKPEEQPQVHEQQEVVRRSVNQSQSKRELRLELMRVFDEDALKVLCADIEEEIKKKHQDFQLDLEVVGGDRKEVKVHNLIEYLDCEKYLPYLLTAAKRERPDINI